MLIGGAMACTFFQAMGLGVGKSLVEPDRIDMAKDLLARAGARLTLPHDAVVAPALDQGARAHVVARDHDPGRRSDVRHRAANSGVVQPRDRDRQDR